MIKITKRYIADQNATSMLLESGLYANPSGTGQWIGKVQSHEIDENFNYQPIRYTNSTSRNVQEFVDGQIEYNGTISYYPQDFKMVGYALGSITDGGSPSPYGHKYRETNSDTSAFWTSRSSGAFISFAVEDVHSIGQVGSSSIRYVKGCMIDTWTLSWDQGGILEAETEYIAQDITYASGTVAAGSTATPITTAPFVWSDVRVHIPSGTVVTEVTAGELSIANSIERRYYSNGSKVTALPVPLARNHEVSLTLDQTAEDFKTFYTQRLVSGTTFNMMIEVTKSITDGLTGSQYAFFMYSGCKLTDVEAPTEMEGVNEVSLTIQPTSLACDEQNTVQYAGLGSVTNAFTGDIV